MIIVFVDSEFRNEDPNQRSKRNFVDYNCVFCFDDDYWLSIFFSVIEIEKTPPRSIEIGFRSARRTVTGRFALQMVSSELFLFLSLNWRVFFFLLVWVFFTEEENKIS